LIVIGRSDAKLQEFNQGARRCVSQHTDYSPAPRGEQDFGKRRALKPLEGPSFAGALLQCLYHLPKLKALLFEYENQNEDDMRPITSMLVDFFKSMDSSDTKSLNQAADELIKCVLTDCKVQLFSLQQILRNKT